LETDLGLRARAPSVIPLQNPGAGTLEARRTGFHKPLIYSILLMDGQTLPYDYGF
jgi:hypothetical protein